MNPYRNVCNHNNRIIFFSLHNRYHTAWTCQDCGRRFIEKKPYPWGRALVLWVVIFLVSCGLPVLVWMGGGR